MIPDIAGIVAGLMTARATIRRMQLSPDGAGGHVETETVVAANVPCRVGGAALRGVTFEDGQRAAYPSKALYLPVATDLQMRDTVEVGGVRYLVQSVEAQQDGVYRRALVEERQLGPVA